jgi:16S rRNA (cytosine1402-N4)-methyltransferase
MAPRDQDTEQTAQGHIPVMLAEVIQYLNVQPGGQYIDATFGGGGHSQAILEASEPNGSVLALDADPAAIERSAPLKSQFGDRFSIAHANFSELSVVATRLGFENVNGILFDLGLSSFQLDQHERGFSLHADTRLDMRLNPEREGLSAWEIINQWDAEQIAEVLFHFGEERQSRRVARMIVDRRAIQPINTNAELAEIVETAVGGRRGKRIHPATRTFQAIRIAVNEELDALRSGLNAARDLLGGGGRVAVISFHSLEDRIVKQFFQLEARDCICPPDFPVCNCDHKSSLRIITRRVVTASDEEIRANPRSRSARLRVAERI